MLHIALLGEDEKIALCHQPQNWLEQWRTTWPHAPTTAMTLTGQATSRLWTVSRSCDWWRQRCLAPVKRSTPGMYKPYFFRESCCVTIVHAFCLKTKDICQPRLKAAIYNLFTGAMAQRYSTRLVCRRYQVRIRVQKVVPEYRLSCFTRVET